MEVMADEMKALFESTEAMVLCAASAEGMPNGAAIGMRWVIDDETVYISNRWPI